MDLAQAPVVDWVPERDARKPAGERKVYRVLEDVHTLAGPRKRDPVHRLRRILIHSTAVAAGQSQAREKRLARAREEMDKLAEAAGGRHYKPREKVAARAGVIASKRRVTACLRWSVTTDEHGIPALAWHMTPRPHAGGFTERVRSPFVGEQRHRVAVGCRTRCGVLGEQAFGLGSALDRLDQGLIRVRGDSSVRGVHGDERLLGDPGGPDDAGDAELLRDDRHMSRGAARFGDEGRDLPQVESGGVRRREVDRTDHGPLPQLGPSRGWKSENPGHHMTADAPQVGRPPGDQTSRGVEHRDELRDGVVHGGGRSPATLDPGPHQAGQFAVGRHAGRRAENFGEQPRRGGGPLGDSVVGSWAVSSTGRFSLKPTGYVGNGTIQTNPVATTPGPLR